MRQTLIKHQAVWGGTTFERSWCWLLHTAPGVGSSSQGQKCILHQGYSYWAKSKNNRTKEVLDTRLQRHLPSEFLSCACRNLTLQNCFRGTCEGISHFGRLILSLLEFFTAFVKTDSNVIQHSWGSMKKSWEREEEEKEVGWEFRERMGESWTGAS